MSLEIFRRAFGIPKTITIKWSYPKKVDDVLQSQTLKEERWGLYQISTKIDKDVTFLYIGKSWEDYHKRLKSHKKTGLNNTKAKNMSVSGHLISV